MREWWWSSSRFGTVPGFFPPEYRAWLLTVPLTLSRPSRPTDPHISPRRATVQTAPTVAIIMGLQGKVYTSVRDTRMFTSFFRFPRVPSLFPAARKKKRKKKKNAVVYALRQGGKASAAQRDLSCFLKEE